MSDYKKSQKYLESFVNYEKKAFYPYKKTLKLERVQLLLERLNISYQRLKVIHIAGTKGKGSTAYFCANILASLGYKTGLYTSPHLYDFRERIQIVTSNQKPEVRGQRSEKIDSKTRIISKIDVVRIVEEARPTLEKLRKHKIHEAPTFFEIYTAIAFKYFLEQNCDFVVLETGLGGRLDATNVVKPLVSIITHLGYDHMDKLGNKLSDIAYEKAGIIKNNIPVVSAQQQKTALNEIRKKCKATKSPIYIYKKDFLAKRIVLKNDCTSFDFSFLNNNYKNIKISLKGLCQVENAVLSLAAMVLLKEKGIIKQQEYFRQGITATYLPGRFEVVSKKPLTVIDIAHNPLSFVALKENLEIYFPKKKIILIFAASQDKDVKAMLKNFPYDEIILTKFSNPRAMPPNAIKDICKLVEPSITDNFNEAYCLARELWDKQSIVVVAGSLFLVAECRNLSC